MGVQTPSIRLNNLLTHNNHFKVTIKVTEALRYCNRARILDVEACKGRLGVFNSVGLCANVLGKVYNISLILHVGL